VAVSPVRALLAAHLQTTWNRSARELSRQGAWVLVLTVALLGLLAAGPLVFGLGLVGWMMGRALDHPVTPVALGGLLALASLGGGLFGGILGGARQLTWESYRGYPLRLPALYLAELGAGLGDLFPLTLAVGLGALLAGLGLAAPALLPLIPLVYLETLLTLLALQLLAGGLAEALVKRLRVALVVLGILAWMLSTLFTTRLPQHTRGTRPPVSAEQAAKVEALGRSLGRAVSVLPTHAAALSLLRAREGRWGAALALHAYPLAVLLLLMLGGARLLGRPSEGSRPVRAGGAPERLWSFRSPAAGVGRLHFQTLMGSHLGKFAFVMPLMTVVLLKGPFAQLRGQSLWAIPAAFAYLSLVGNNFVFNQFGLDRHGIKALLLLPVDAEDLLRGKLLGMAAHQGLQALLLLVLLALFERPLAVQLIAGLLLMGCYFLAQASLGQWTSAWMPRTMAPDSLKNSNMPFALGMLSLAASGLWTGLYGGAYALLSWLAPAALLPGMALLFGLTLAAHRGLRPSAAAYLNRRREKLVEALG